MASIRQTATSPSWAYFSIVTRAWELAVGALVALALPLVARLDRRLAIPLSWVGLSCIGLAAALFSDTDAYPGDAALLPVLGAAAVICGGSALASRRFGAEALLGTPPFQRVGAWSYSWYLWHWPALVLVPGRAWARSVGARGGCRGSRVPGGRGDVVRAAGAPDSSHPDRRSSARARPWRGRTCWPRLRSRSWSVSGSLVAPLVPTAAPARLTALDNSASPSLRADLIAGARTIKVPSNLRPRLTGLSSAAPRIIADGCELGPGRDQIKPCSYGDAGSPTTVVLFGDSHAGHWFDALTWISKQRHWRLVVMTKEGCTAAEVTLLHGSDNRVLLSGERKQRPASLRSTQRS